MAAEATRVFSSNKNIPLSERKQIEVEKESKLKYSKQKDQHFPAYEIEVDK